MEHASRRHLTSAYGRKLLKKGSVTGSWVWHATPSKRKQLCSILPFAAAKDEQGAVQTPSTTRRGSQGWNNFAQKASGK